MIEPTQTGERRRHPRITLANGIAALPKKSTIAIGTIVDIGRGGIGIRYAANEGEIGQTFEIDILLTDQNCYITKLPVTATSDFALENIIPFSLINERRCGLEFHDLSEIQAYQLDKLLANYEDKENR
jgi:c-di-GMP-binding flagellar brake protein YcgR